VSYRDKTIDTGLGPVTLRRAWYHCAACGRGFAPRDRELGVARDTMSPGLAKMTDRAGAALPFTVTAKLLGEFVWFSARAGAAEKVRSKKLERARGDLERLGRGLGGRYYPTRPRSSSVSL
jgi:hypothetical protein